MRAAVGAGEDPQSALAAGRAVLEGAGIDVEYLSLVEPETMEPLGELRGDALALVAGRLGDTRLIDNVLVSAARPADEIRTNDNEVATPLRAPTP